MEKLRDGLKAQFLSSHLIMMRLIVIVRNYYGDFN